MNEIESSIKELRDMMQIRSKLEDQRWKDLREILWASSKSQFVFHGAEGREHHRYFSALSKQMFVFDELNEGEDKIKNLERDQEYFLAIGLSILAIGLALPFLLVDIIGIIILALGIGLFPYKRKIERKIRQELKKEAFQQLASLKKDDEDREKDFSQWEDYLKSGPDDAEAIVRGFMKQMKEMRTQSEKKIE